MVETNIHGVPTLKTLCETLVEACGATYIAAAEQTLALSSPVIFFHVPVGHDPERSVREVLDGHMDGADVVRHVSHTMRPDIRHVDYTDVHAFGRVPLYVQGQPGLEDVSIEEGLGAAHRYLAGETEITRPPSDSIALETLIERLADEGAGAVELRNSMLTERNLVTLRVPMTPATGHEVAGPYTHVTVDGGEYGLRAEFTLDGPGGYGAMRTPLYVGDDVRGLPPVTVEEGMENFAKVQEIAEGDGEDSRYEVLRDFEAELRPQ